MRTSQFRPHTVLVGGITSLGKARLGDALPADPFKPTKPDKTMPNPTKPTKPAKVKTSPKDVDYSTPYVPPDVEQDTAGKPLSAGEIAFGDFVICDDAVPCDAQKYQTVFDNMKPGKCIRLPSKDVDKIAHALNKYIKLGKLAGKVKTAKHHKPDGLGRVWWLAA